MHLIDIEKIPKLMSIKTITGGKAKVCVSYTCNCATNKFNKIANMRRMPEIAVGRMDKLEHNFKSGYQQCGFWWSSTDICSVIRNIKG